MEKKEIEGKKKCYLKVVVLVMAGLGQVLLPNLNNVVVGGTHFDDLFSIYIVTIPNLIRIMQDPNMKIISVI